MGWRDDKQSILLWISSGLLLTLCSVIGAATMQTINDVKALQETSAAREAFSARDREDIQEIKADVKRLLSEKH